MSIKIENDTTLQATTPQMQTNGKYRSSFIYIMVYLHGWKTDICLNGDIISLVDRAMQYTIATTSFILNDDESKCKKVYDIVRRIMTPVWHWHTMREESETYTHAFTSFPPAHLSLSLCPHARKLLSGITINKNGSDFNWGTRNSIPNHSCSHTYKHILPP